MKDVFFAAATEAFAEREAESEKAFRRECIKIIQGYMMPASQQMPDTGNAKIEVVETAIPRWKYGVKLVNKVGRAVFDNLLDMVKENKGKYSKEANCWVFSNQAKRTAFLNNLQKNNKYIEITRTIKIDEIVDTQNIKFEKGYVVMTAKVEFPTLSRLYKREDGVIKIDETCLEYGLDSIIDDYAIEKSKEV